MNIWDLMDCDDCEYLRRYPGRDWGDPESCYPPEDECSCEAPDAGPCDRMLRVIHDRVCDGELETTYGTFFDTDFLLSESGKEALKERGIPEGGRFNFSSVPYWWIPNVYNPVSKAEEPFPYADEAAIYNDWFV